MPADPMVLLADVDVLIDYRESELAILALVAQHVGRVTVLPSVLDEVQDVRVQDCAELGIEIAEVVETERMLQVAAIESQVSFNDRLCLVTCREEGWTFVTNDGAIRRLCQRHGVKTCFGLALMVDLVGAGVLTRERAETVAHRIHSSNPSHINERVLTRFFSALDSPVLA